MMLPEAPQARASLHCDKRRGLLAKANIIPKIEMFKGGTR